MDRKKVGKALLFPHIAIMIVLVPIATAFLVYSMVFLSSSSAVSIISYVLAAYTFTVWCFRIPNIIRFVKSLKNNKYIKRWNEDTKFRVNLSLYGALIFNIAYALLHLGLGFWHRSFWYFSLSGYYISLGVMRLFLARYTSHYNGGEKLKEEYKKYRICGIVFLVMNLMLTLMVFFMVYWNRTFVHREITTIAMAAYTFTTLVFSIINAIKFRRYNSPVYSASKAISLAAACVSVLTLEATMLTTFGDGNMPLATRRIMLGVSGGVICVFIITMALYMIVRGTKKIRLLDMGE